MNELIELEKKNKRNRFINNLLYNLLVILFLAFFCIHDMSIKIIGMSLSALLYIDYIIKEVVIK